MDYNTNNPKFLTALLVTCVDQLVAAEEEIARLKERIAWLTNELNDADLKFDIVAEHMQDATVEHLHAN